MPVVGQAIIAVGSAFSTAIAGVSLGNLLATTALSILGQAIQQAMMKPPKRPGIQTEYTTEGGTTPQKFVLGWYATAGQMVCPPMTSGRGNRILTYVIALGAIPDMQIDTVLIDDEEVEFAPPTEVEAVPEIGPIPTDKPGWWYQREQIEPPVYEPSNGRWGYPGQTTQEYGRPATGKHKGKVWLRYHDGSQTAADPFLLATYGPGTAWAQESERPWTADMAGIGTCYAILNFAADPDIWPGMPRCKFVVHGIPLYDPRADSSVGGDGPQRWADPATWVPSTNAAVQSYNIFRGIPVEGGPYWGLGVPAEDLPLANWIAGMNACDEDVDGAPRWRAGFEVSVDDEPLDILGEIGKAACIQFAEIGGVWKLRVGPPGAPVWFHTDADLISTEEAVFEPHPGLDGTYNGVAASYPEPEQLWKPKDAPPRYNALWEEADQGRRLVADLSLPACPWLDQVQRTMRGAIEEERRFGRHRHALPAEAEILEPLDAIAWTSDENGYTGKVFEIVETAEDLITGDVHVAVRERDASDFDWRPEYKLPSSIPPTVVVEQDPVSPRGIQVEGVALADAASIARRPAIRARWGTLGIEDATTIMWERRLGLEVVRGASADPGAGELTISEGVLPETDYEVRLRFAGGQRDWQWTAWLPVTTPDVRLSMAELDAAARQRVEDLEAWIDDYPTVERAAIDQAIGEALNEAYDARDLALENLDLAAEYTDTRVQAEETARSAADQALATQVQTLTAVLNSDNYLVNPRFIDGKTGWAGNGASAAVILDQDPASPDPIIAGAPTPKFLSLAPAATTRQLQQIFDIADWQAGEKFQWRLRMGSGDPLPLRVRVTFRRADNSNIAWEDEPITLSAGEWRTYSRQHDYAPGTERIAFIIYLDASAFTAPLGLADTAATRVDVSVKAELSGLQLAFANHETAQTLWQAEAESRFSDTDDELDAVAVALSNRYTKSEADGATSAANLALKTALESPGGSIKAAQDAAQAASDVAGGKGRVFVQASAPPAAERLPQNLWIDTTGGANTPKRWTGSAWAAVTDKVASDAAAAAAAAQDAAGQVAADLATNYLTKVETNQAVAAARTDLGTRMDGIESAASAETLARSTADQALAQRATDLEATTGNHTGRLITVEAAVATSTGAIATLNQRVAVTSEANRIVKDGRFDDGFTHWPGGNLQILARLVTRDPGNAQWWRATMPAERAFLLEDFDAGGWIGTGRRDAAPETEFTFGGDVAIRPNSRSARIHLRFYNAAGTLLRNDRIDADPVKAESWQRLIKTVLSPAGTATAELYVIGAGTGTQDSWFTNLFAYSGADAMAVGSLKMETILTEDGSSAELGLGVRAGGVETGAGQAGVFLRASSSGLSELLCSAASFYLYDPTTETAPFAYLDGQLYLNARVTAQHLEIDQLLSFTDSGALTAFKSSPDDTADGLFFGKIDDAFAFSASRTAPDGRAQEVSFTNDGFVLRNPKFVAASATPDAVVRVLSSFASTSLAPARMVRIPNMIGGGGSGGTSVNGGGGSPTIVELFDGSVLKRTITANGGAGGAGTTTGAYGGRSQGGAGLSPDNRGGGGDGTRFIYDSKQITGVGGSAGQARSVDWIDVSEWSDPRIKITIGTGGVGMEPGQPGEVRYQTLSAADIRTDTVPLTPTGYGSFPKGNNTPGSFPDLGGGIWLITELNGNPLRLGTVSLGGGFDQVIMTQSSMAIISSQTPTYTGATDGRTVVYNHFSMGAWA